MLDTPENGTKDNGTYIQVDGEPLLLKVTYVCDLGFAAVGPVDALCVNDSVFKPSTPPMCMRFVCEEPYGKCPNATVVNSSRPYYYQSTRGIVCQAGFRLPSGGANGSSVCEANRTSTVVCPPCEGNVDQSSMFCYLATCRLEYLHVESKQHQKV